MNFELMASMMCADYGHLEREVRELEAGGLILFISIYGWSLCAKLCHVIK